MRTIHPLLLLFVAAAFPRPAAAVSLALFNTPYIETFDTLVASGTGALLPAGWSFLETGTGANATYAAGTGSSATGNTYSFGASGSSERALGTVRSTSLAASFGVRVTNLTGETLPDLALAYVGEQWRLGAIGRIDRLDFAYSLDAGTLATGTWIDVDALDFVAPTTTGTVGALVGNATPHRTHLAHTLSGLNLAAGASLMLRWTDFDAAGADDGLAIDDVSITAPKTLTPTVAESLPPYALWIAFAGLVAFASRVRRTARAG